MEIVVKEKVELKDKIKALEEECFKLKTKCKTFEDNLSQVTNQLVEESNKSSKLQSQVDSFTEIEKENSKHSNEISDKITVLFQEFMSSFLMFLENERIFNRL